MKKISIAMVAIMAAISFASCNKVSKEQYQQVTNTNDSLMYVALQQGNEIYELSTTLKSVSEQLDQINGQIEISNGEDESLITKRDQLLQKLALVQKTIQEKQAALDDLQKKYGAQLSQNKELKKTIDRLQTEVSDYQQEITGYKTQIAQNEERISNLSDTLSQTQQVLEETQAVSEQQQQVISNQDQMLNTAYYLVADKSQLKDMGLLEGGAFSKKRLTTQGFTAEGFTKVDIRQLGELSIPSKKAEILSSHPATSYTLEAVNDNASRLVIKDAAAFWSNSRYLVIKTK